MLNVGIVHGFVGGGGGTEKTLLSIIEFFKEKNHNVTLYTFSKPSISISGVKIKSTLPFRLPLFGLYQRYSEKNLIRQAEKDDIIIHASGGLAVPSDPSKQIVVYCHSDFQNELEKNITKYKGLWSIYYKPYSEFSKNIYKLIQNKNIHLITNSEFTNYSIKSKYNKNSTVIYPPVDISEFKNNISTKKQKVVTVSRFSQEKNLEFALDVIKNINTQYYLIGNTKTKSNKLYFNKLVSKINKQKIGSKINLLKNIPRNQVIQNLQNSKVYFHSSPETFGISIVEAIAADCIPIVPDNSAHKETVPYDQLRYMPDDVVDATKKITDVLSGKFDNLLDSLKESIMQFDKENFKKKLGNYLETEFSIQA